MHLRCLPLLALFIFACSKEDSVTPGELLGTWRLTSVYLDPGDGSGTFQPADYAREFTFFADSTYLTSRDICTLSASGSGGGEGRYSPDRRVIFPTHCRILAEYLYTIEGRELAIAYRCIEGCAERYVKIGD